jgi:hypothetical protein
MSRFRRMIQRFTDWNENTVKIEPPPAAEPKAAPTPNVQEKAPAAKRLPMWRLAQVPNRKGRMITIEVKANGGVYAADIERVARDQVTHWVEIRAANRSQARALIADGKGEKRTVEGDHV